jgi:hypothetical protein
VSRVSSANALFGLANADVGCGISRPKSSRAPVAVPTLDGACDERCSEKSWSSQGTKGKEGRWGWTGWW